MQFAVTLLLFRPKAPYTQILSISRGSALNDWGLVGGKVEPGEHLIDAIVREVQEESDIRFGPKVHGDSPKWKNIARDIAKDLLTPVYTGIAKTRLTTTFLATGAHLPKEFPHTREGKVKWLTPHHLIGHGCTYHEYNRKLFEHLRIPMGFEGNPE